MESIFEKIKAKNKYACIMGDCNVNTYKDEHKKLGVNTLYIFSIFYSIYIFSQK